MYGYEDHLDIHPEQILQKVTELEIFEWVLGEKVDLSIRYLSPFRDDTNPDCRFEEREDGTLLFLDFGDPYGKTHRSCFNMVQAKYNNCSLSTAMKIICQHFGISEDTTNYESGNQVRKVQHTEDNTSHAPATILWTTRNSHKKDKLYWSKFLINIEDLKEDGTGIVATITIDSRKGRRSFTPHNICYSYPFADSGHVKLYQPYNNPKYKWISNCDENDIGNINNLPPTGKELILQKSYKDHRVQRNVGFGQPVVWLQNEGCIPHPKILLDLSTRFELITIFYDNDQPGREAAARLMYEFLRVNPQAKVRCVWLPQRKYPHKDLGEFVSKEGRSDTQEVLKYIGIKPLS